MAKVIDADFTVVTDEDDAINPDHYAELGIEPWDVVLEWYGPGAALSHVLKYLARAGRKKNAPLLEDVRKAKAWLERLERWLRQKEMAP